MDSHFEKDKARLRAPAAATNGHAAAPPAGDAKKKVTKTAGTAKAAGTGAVKKAPGTGAKVGTKAPAGKGTKKEKEADPLQLARAEIATLNKELIKVQEAADQRVEAVTKEANARFDEYEATISRLERDVYERDRTIREKVDEIRKIEKERDARYQQYEEYLMIGEKMRAELHNALIELKGNIRVFARVRPSLEAEKRGASWVDHYQYPEGTDHRALHVVEVPGHTSVLGKQEANKTMPFTFDKVFGPQAQQQQIFDEIAQLVQSALDGYKVCIFAYGQTGSGKTYTMEGPDPGVNSDLSGMIPRAVRQIFENTQWKSKQSGFTYKLTCSFLQIYNETIHDLLNPQEMYERGPGKEELKHEIRNTETESVVTNLKEEEVTDPSMVFRLLQRASDNRKTAGTKINEVSSRSHSVFIMKIKGYNSATQQEMNGQLNLIDLAGSERLAKSQAEGDRLKETQHINKSLACLGDVIAALGRGASTVPFRNSKLTHLLQPSMTNQSKTLMFVNVNPHPDHLPESICSLRFAAKVNACEIGIAKKKVVSVGDKK